MNQVKQTLAEFTQQALALTPNGYFETLFDADWRSTCELQQVEKATQWRPFEQPNPVQFSGLANAVGAAIHPDITAYFSSFWSGSIEAKSIEGPVSLIQLWNEDDFTRLIENLVGHFMAQQKQKLPFSVFFATTDPESELFLSIENCSGRILLEEPGRAPIKEVASNLKDFLKRLTAVQNTPEIY